MRVVLLLFVPMLVSGVEWDSIVQLTTDTTVQSLGNNGQRSFAVDPAGDIWVFWRDGRVAPVQIFQRRFYRAAGFWLPETCLTRVPNICYNPSATADQQGNIHLVWHTQGNNPRGIWYKRYSAATGRWGPETLLVPSLALPERYYPVIAVRPGTGELHLVWYASPDTGGLPQVFHKEFQPGTGWLPEEQVTDTASSHSAATVAVDSAGNLGVVWLGQDNGGQEKLIFCRRRVNRVWQETELVSDFPGPTEQFSATVAAAGNDNWHIVWQGIYPGVIYRQIFHRERTLSGWGEIRMVTGGVTYQQQQPFIDTRAGGECHLVWAGRTQHSPNNYQLIYAFRDRYGNWSEPEPLTPLSPGDVSRPAVICDTGQGLHLVWEDTRSGNKDVFYRYGAITGVGVEEKGVETPVRLITGKRAPIPASSRVYNCAGMAVAPPRFNSLAAGVYVVIENDGPRGRIYIIR